MKRVGKYIQLCSRDVTHYANSQMFSGFHRKRNLKFPHVACLEFSPQIFHYVQDIPLFLLDALQTWKFTLSHTNTHSPEVSQLRLTVWRYGNRSAGLLIYCIANIAEQSRNELRGGQHVCVCVCVCVCVWRGVKPLGTPVETTNGDRHVQPSYTIQFKYITSHQPDTFNTNRDDKDQFAFICFSCCGYQDICCRKHSHPAM